MNHPLPNTLPAFIRHFLKPYRVMALGFVFLAILAGCWGPFNSVAIKHIINLLPQVQEGDVSFLMWPTALIVLNFIIFDNVTWRSIGYINYKFQPVIKNQIIRETLNFVLANTHQFFQDNLSGRISNQITALADNIDRILVSEQGKIIQDGAHTELLNETGLYRTLWEAQVDGFLPDK